MTSAEKIPAVERLVSLTAALLSRRMTKEEILREVSGYRAAPSVGAAERQFERDKKILREQGIPLIATPDAAHGQTVRYWIDDSSWQSREVRPSPVQAALASLALEATSGSSRHLPSRALTKLRALSPMDPVAADVEITTTLDVADPEDSFDALAYAIAGRRTVTFFYWSARGTRGVRTVDPWRLTRTGGAWYLLGYDHDRAEARAFRLSRIQGEVEASETEGGYEIPPDPALPGGAGAPHTPARLAVAPGAAALLRRRGRVTGQRAGRDVVDLDAGDLNRLAEQVASYGGDVLPLAPPALVAAVRATFERAAGYAR